MMCHYLFYSNYLSTFFNSFLKFNVVEFFKMFLSSKSKFFLSSLPPPREVGKENLLTSVILHMWNALL